MVNFICIFSVKISCAIFGGYVDMLIEFISSLDGGSELPIVLQLTEIKLYKGIN